MSNIKPSSVQELPGTVHSRIESPVIQGSGVSWGAIIAGAAGAAALSLILLVLGTGLGMTVVSPWVDRGISAATFGVGAIVWLALTHVVPSGMGGYLAGRLRVKWVGVHTDEVYFRDTAHGFLAWAVAAIATAAMLTTTIGSILGGGLQAGAAVAGGAAGTSAAALVREDGGDVTGFESASGAMDYFVDSLFRTNAEGPAGESPATGASGMPGAETARIFGNALRTGALPEEDAEYLGQVVARRTGLTQQEARGRVEATFARLQDALEDSEAAMREAADEAREATAYASLWLFVSLLSGAFAASLAATYGGRRRDA